MFSTSESMLKIKNNTVKFMITSPPYWDLKNYEAENQIGFKEDYNIYLDRLKKVWLETYRVLSKDGIAIININTKSYHKKLQLIPNDIIKQMKEIGYKFRDINYWHKSSAIPSLKNFGDHYEYFLIFSKSNKFTFNPKDYFDYKHPHSQPSINLWNINKKFGSIGKKYMIHPAVFAEEYIIRMIKFFTNENDIVLDPFLGSGTTLIASYKTNRICFGFELNNDEYSKLLKDRINEAGLNLAEVEFIRKS